MPRHASESATHHLPGDHEPQCGDPSSCLECWRAHKDATTRRPDVKKVNLRLTLLGSPSVQRDGVVVHVDTRKAVALAALLVMSGGPIARDAAATLLWPDSDTPSARAALRRTLSSLRAALGEAVTGDRRTIELRLDDHAVDVLRFRRLLAGVRDHGHDIAQGCAACLPHLEEAIALCHGDFLAGFTLRDAPEFDDWQAAQGEALRRELSHALEGASRGLADGGRSEEAAAYARRLVSLDGLHEPSHRLLMQIYDRSGQRSAAIHQYRECVRILDRELAVPPMEETTRLYEAITEGVVPASTGDDETPTSFEPVSINRRLPLVGRDQEWQALQRT